MYDDYPQEAADFINKCILRDPKERMGSLEEVKAHPWFANFDWDGLLNQTIDPLYKPGGDLMKNFDEKNVNDYQYNDTKLLEEFVDELKRASG